MEVAPRLAERWAPATPRGRESVEVDASTGAVTASCMLFAGTGVAEYRFARDRTVLTVGDGVLDGDDEGPTTWSRCGLSRRRRRRPSTVVRRRRSTLPPRTSSTAGSSSTAARVSRPSRTSSRRGALAALLGGQSACSRPLASDRDWFSDWLGLSGMRVKPELCLTLGISGSVQHLIGIRDARLIAAVNNDEDAPIFAQADFGVVADLREFLPALIQRVKERGVHPVWREAGQPTCRLVRVLPSVRRCRE